MDEVWRDLPDDLGRALLRQAMTARVHPMLEACMAVPILQAVPNLWQCPCIPFAVEGTSGLFHLVLDDTRVMLTHSLVVPLLATVMTHSNGDYVLVDLIPKHMPQLAPKKHRQVLHALLMVGRRLFPHVHPDRTYVMRRQPPYRDPAKAYLNALCAPP